MAKDGWLQDDNPKASVKFYYKSKPAGKLEDGTQNFVNELWFHCIVNSSLTIDRPANDGDIRNYPNEYAFFSHIQDSLEQEVDGQPLHTWPRIDPASREQLVARGIMTVQQLAEITPRSSAYKSMPTNIKAIVDEARIYMENQKNASGIGDKLKKLESENAALREINDELKDEIKILKSKVQEAA